MIDYYGETDNYIHLKWGNCIKKYNFTDEFIKEYPEFTERYIDYWENGANDGTRKGFKSAFEVVAFAHKKNVPVHFYFNYTDEPAESYEQIISYLVSENTYIPE